MVFSGHGGQIVDKKPLGEKDGYDEILMFYDFDPDKSTQGSLTDDEIYNLFEKARNYVDIVFVADTCHSSGVTREQAQPLPGRFRYGGRYNERSGNYAPPTSPTQAEEKKALPRNVTRITATQYDRLRVQEIRINGQWHGALSWAFARALSGEANTIYKNEYLEREELEVFLENKVINITDSHQRPKLAPTPKTKPVIRLPFACTSSSTPHSPDEIAIAVVGGKTPKGLKHVKLVGAYQPFDLRFEINNQQTNVFSNNGDKLTTLPSNRLNLWQRVIDKERLLKALIAQTNTCYKPIEISLKEGDKSHKKGEKLNFSIKPGDTSFNALTLFNLAGNGELQFLYPLPNQKDPLVIEQFPYKLEPPPEVEPPFGGDDLVAIFCNKPATGLHKLVAKNHGQPNLPPPEQFISQLHGKTCQVGQYAFFSSE